MYCENRRKEVNKAIIEDLATQYNISQIVDYSIHASHGLYLEGTGAMVLDHQTRIAYAVRSKRMDEALLQQFCTDFDYQPVTFSACDSNNVDVYHSNVLMSVANNFVMICLEMIPNAQERATVVDIINQSGKTLIELSEQQIGQFAGNTLELSAKQGNILALSQTAYHSLSNVQVKQISAFAKPVPIDVSTIELAGGSIRCMLAGIHLTKAA